MSVRYTRYTIAMSAVCLAMIATACVNFNNFSGPVRGELPVVACDTVDVSYSKTIVPLLRKNCLECHANSIQTAGVSLEGYSIVRFYANNKRLVGVSSRQAGFISMPPTGPITKCEMDIIRAWVNQGAKNN